MITQIRPDTVFPCRGAESDDVRSRDGQSVEEELDLFVLFLLLYPTHRTLGPCINTIHDTRLTMCFYLKRQPLKIVSVKNMKKETFFAHHLKTMILMDHLN